MRTLCAPGTPRPSWRVFALTVVLGAAAVLLFVPVEPRSDASMRLYLVRVSLLALAWGSCYAAVGLQLLRFRTETTGLARTLLAGSLLAYAALRLLEPLTHFLGPSPITRPIPHLRRPAAARGNGQRDAHHAAGSGARDRRSRS